MVQRIGGPGGRVHLDIETDDVEAEVARLEALGAEKRVQKVRIVVGHAETRLVSCSAWYGCRTRRRSRATLGQLALAAPESPCAARPAGTCSSVPAAWGSRRAPRPAGRHGAPGGGTGCRSLAVRLSQLSTEAVTRWSSECTRCRRECRRGGPGRRPRSVAASLQGGQAVDVEEPWDPASGRRGAGAARPGSEHGRVDHHHVPRRRPERGTWCRRRRPARHRRLPSRSMLPAMTRTRGSEMSAGRRRAHAPRRRGSLDARAVALPPGAAQRSRTRTGTSVSYGPAGGASAPMTSQDGRPPSGWPHPGRTRRRAASPRPARSSGPGPPEPDPAPGRWSGGPRSSRDNSTRWPGRARSPNPWLRLSTHPAQDGVDDGSPGATRTSSTVVDTAGGAGMRAQPDLVGAAQPEGRLRHLVSIRPRVWRSTSQSQARCMRQDPYTSSVTRLRSRAIEVWIWSASPGPRHAGPGPADRWRAKRRGPIPACRRQGRGRGLVVAASEPPGPRTVR